MIDLAKLYVRNHRDQQYMLVGGMMVALVGSLAPRNERALFVTGSPVTPRAFAAIVPPPVAFNGLFDIAGPFGPRAVGSGARASRRGAVPGGAGPNGFAPVDPADVTPGGVSPASAVTPPTQLASLDPLGRGITGGPLAGSGPLSFGPGATAAGPAAPVGPTVPGGGGGGGTTAPVTPIGAVPEPATWAMLLLGFFGLGALLRRRRSAISLVRADRRQT